MVYKEYFIKLSTETEFINQAVVDTPLSRAPQMPRQVRVVFCPQTKLARGHRHTEGSLQKGFSLAQVGGSPSQGRQLAKGFSPAQVGATG